LGFWFVFWNNVRSSASWFQLNQVTIEKSNNWFSSYVELCRLFQKFLFSKNCIFYPVTF